MTMQCETLIALRNYHRKNIAILTMIAGSYRDNGLIVPDRIESELALERAEYDATLREIENQEYHTPVQHEQDHGEDRTMQSTAKRLYAPMTMTCTVTYLAFAKPASVRVQCNLTDYLIQGHKRGLALN